MKLKELQSSELRVDWLKEKLFELGIFSEDRTTNNNINMDEIKYNLDRIGLPGNTFKSQKVHICKLKSVGIEDKSVSIDFINANTEGQLFIACHDDLYYTFTTYVIDIDVTEDNQIKLVLSHSLDEWLDSLVDYNDSESDNTEHQTFTNECIFTVEKVEVSATCKKLDLCSQECKEV